MDESDQYTRDLRLTKSLLIVTSLQKRRDLQAIKYIKEYSGKLTWEPFSNFLIDPEVWEYAVNIQHFDPKLVFCHPDILLYRPSTSLYYRCLCGLSLKAARENFGAVESLEAGKPLARLSRNKATRMARVYNTFICSIINNSTDWTLENGYRTIIATLGITLDGVMRNKIGDIAEHRIRTLVLEWLYEKNLIIEALVPDSKNYESFPRECLLKKNIKMYFRPEPDIAFIQHSDYIAIVEIKGGIDPAGALERYGAATKSFQHAVATSPRCKNFYIAAAYTSELERRIKDDRLVEKTYNVIEILNAPKVREEFFNELFHHVLRLI